MEDYRDTHPSSAVCVLMRLDPSYVYQDMCSTGIQHEIPRRTDCIGPVPTAVRTEEQWILEPFLTYSPGIN